MPYQRTAGLNFDPYARYAWAAPDRGFLAENYPAFYAGANQAPGTAGRLEFAKVRLPVPSSVTNILMYSQTLGSTLTAGQNFAALFTPARALVAQTADQAASWVGTTGLKTMALAGGPYSLSAGDYFVGFWHNGTTAPAWARNISNAIANVGTAAPAFLWGTADTGLTTTAPSTMGTQTAGNLTYWVALS